MSETWCLGCNRKAKRTREVRARVSTHLGRTRELRLPLCPDCLAQLTDDQVVEAFQRQWDLPRESFKSLARPRLRGQRSSANESTPPTAPSLPLLTFPSPARPDAMAEDEPRLKSVVDVARAFGSVDQEGRVVCPACGRAAALSPDARGWACIGDWDGSPAQGCGARGGGLSLANWRLTAALGRAPSRVEMLEACRAKGLLEP